MWIRGLRFALSSVAAALLASCGASQPPIGAPGAMLSQPAKLELSGDARTAWSYEVLYRFGPLQYHGIGPAAPLLDVNGTLYGTTAYGGKYRNGTVFRFRGGKEKVLYSFGAAANDGANPYAPLIVVNGTLYGTTEYGGSGECRYTGGNGCGTVYSISVTGNEKVLYSFAGNSNDDGASPTAPLLELNGTLYGTTIRGGTHNKGTIYSISTSGSETILHSFAGASNDGAGPSAPLINVSGTLYGTTQLGGGTGCLLHLGCGTVYEITTSGSEKLVYRFAGGQDDGSDPVAPLLDVDGTLYGTAYSDGAYDSGTVFSVTTSGTEKVLHSFGTDGDGQNPLGGLIDVRGALYGTTINGGSRNLGVVYRLAESGSETVLYSFGDVSNDGNWPNGLLNVGNSLYGTAEQGGYYCTRKNIAGCGTIFKLSP